MDSYRLQLGLPKSALKFLFKCQRKFGGKPEGVRKDLGIYKYIYIYNEVDQLDFIAYLSIGFDVSVALEVQ